MFLEEVECFNEIQRMDNQAVSDLQGCTGTVGLRRALATTHSGILTHSLPAHGSSLQHTVRASAFVRTTPGGDLGDTDTLLRPDGRPGLGVASEGDPYAALGPKGRQTSESLAKSIARANCTVILAFSV